MPRALISPSAVAAAGSEAAVSVVAMALAVSVAVAAGAAASVVVVVAGDVVLSPLQPATKIRTVNSNSNFFMMYSLWWLKKAVFIGRVADRCSLTSPA
jgi:hypothetical protein